MKARGCGEYSRRGEWRARCAAEGGTQDVKLEEARMQGTEDGGVPEGSPLLVSLIFRDDHACLLGLG